MRVFPHTSYLVRFLKLGYAEESSVEVIFRNTFSPPRELNGTAVPIWLRNKVAFKYTRDPSRKDEYIASVQLHTSRTQWNFLSNATAKANGVLFR
jgi:Fe2+ transport system protein FeoA